MNDEPEIKSSTDEFEKALKEKDSAKYVLRLYVSGMTAKSVRAIENIREICSKYLEGRYELEVIDLYSHPEMSRKEQIIAAPTLIKSLPTPLRKFIGDLSDTEKILVGLDLVSKKSEGGQPLEK